MNNYSDAFSRIHHKPVTTANPFPSGNGWLYTAYAARVGVPVNQLALEVAFDLCSQKVDGRTVLIRNPGQVNSPFSRDEVLGAVDLGLLKPEHLDGWSFSPFPPQEFKPLRLAQQLVQLYEHREDRNYFWQNSLEQVYRLAFSVPVVDRYFILQKWGTFQFYNPLHLAYAAIAKVDSLTGTSSGIRFLKYGKSKEAMVKEFPEDHPITEAVYGPLTSAK